MNTNKHTNEFCQSHNNSGQNHNRIESHRHGNALVCSIEAYIPGNIETIKNKMIIELELLAEWVEDQGGITGHIKALLDDSICSYMLSTTGEEVEIKELSRPKSHVSIVAIVFEVNEKELQSRLVSLIDMLNIV